MMRRILRMVVGILLVWCAYHMHAYSTKVAINAVTVDVDTFNTEENADLVVGPNPLVAAQRPDVQEKQEWAALVEYTAIGAVLTGIVLFLSGAIPLIMWALFGSAKWFTPNPEERKPADEPQAPTQQNPERVNQIPDSQRP